MFTGSILVVIFWEIYCFLVACFFQCSPGLYPCLSNLNLKQVSYDFLFSIKLFLFCYTAKIGAIYIFFVCEMQMVNNLETGNRRRYLRGR